MVDPQPDSANHRPLLVDRAHDLARFARHVTACDVVALDVEANSLYAYRERTCIVQVTAGHRSAIIDPLAVTDLSPLRDAVCHPDVEAVFHGGDFDISQLSRDHGFVFERVFDTMIAASLLGEPKIGLANLVLDAFGVTLDKRFQRADWARRPLTEEQIEYLHRDTAYLCALRERLKDRLAEEDLEEEASIEFRHLAGRRGKPHSFERDGWRRIKGTARLDDREKAVLERLFVWREREAEKRDLPPFKVLSPHLLVDLSKSEPPRSGNPRDLHALPGRLRQRYGRHVLRAMRDGLRDAEEGRVPRIERAPRPTDEERRQHKRARSVEEAIKKWRRGEAEARDVPNLVVLPNRALDWISKRLPGSTDDLVACPDIGPKRTARYGRRIIEVIRRSAP